MPQRRSCQPPEAPRLHQPVRPGLFERRSYSSGDQAFNHAAKEGRSGVRGTTGAYPDALHPLARGYSVSTGLRASELVNERPSGEREPTCKSHGWDDRPQPPGLPQGRGPMEARLSPDRPARPGNSRCGLAQPDTHVSGIRGRASQPPPTPGDRRCSSIHSASRKHELCSLGYPKSWTRCSRRFQAPVSTGMSSWSPRRSPPLSAATS